MSNADWIFTVKIRVKGLCVHDEPDAETVARWVVDEECGFGGLTDWPDDYQIISVEPADFSPLVND
jgi:hypothetical protein